LRTSRYIFGQIVLAWIDDKDGAFKDRPAVIIDDNIDLMADNEIQVVAVSTSQRGRCPYYHIKVHHDDQLDPDTGLCYSSWAKCNWVRYPKPPRIVRSLGHMPSATMDEIIRVYDRLLAALAGPKATLRAWRR
jgi:mRNA-degrading endonuclease toxin of MazEF toxin-antitoxin module